METVKALITKKPYIYSNWTQPILTSDGTWASSTFAVQASSVYSSYYAYKAFDGNTTTSFQDNGTKTSSYLKFYNPNPINVTKIVWSGTPTYGTIIAGIVYGSNNDSDWTQLATFSGGTTTGGTMNLSSNKNYYRFYKITPTDWTDKSNTHTNGWAKLQITATQRTGGGHKCEIFKINNVYQAVL